MRHKEGSCLRKVLAAVLMFLPLMIYGVERDDLQKIRMSQDLGIIRGVFNARYAPAQWKKAHCDWDLDEAIQFTKDRICNTENIRIRDYQHYVRDLLGSMKDYHVGIQFYATESAVLPFSVRGAEGRYFISYVDRSKLSNDFFPFEVGDELVSFDGRPAAEVVEEVRAREVGDASPLTDSALAAYYLTHRSAMSGHVVPKGGIVVSFKKKGNDKVYSRQLLWQYTEEMISEGTPYKYGVAGPRDHYGTDRYAFLRSYLSGKKMLTPLASTLHNAFDQVSDKSVEKKSEKEASECPFCTEEETCSFCEAEESSDCPFCTEEEKCPFCEEEDLSNGEEEPWDEDELDEAEGGRLLGDRDSRLPDLGNVVWSSSRRSSFQAYIFENDDGKNIGFIRIPHYSAGEMEANEFYGIIDLFEENTDALIIDQLDNPGGSVFYLYALVSMLSDQPMKTPRHRMTLTQEDVYDAKYVLSILQYIKSDFESWMVFGPSIGGYPVNFQFAQFMADYFRFICSEWEAGKRLTDPHHLLGVDYINPDPDTNYSKPILVLINELDFSGGDFFPAILQDNKRAVIMGQRTAGAGGCVEGWAYPNPFGIAYISFTVSLAERVSNNPIENLGITPDIDYQISADDLQYGHQEMAAEVNRVISAMIRGEITP